MEVIIKIDDSCFSRLKKLLKSNKIEIICREEEFNPDYAIINGIKLKRKNENLSFCEYFTFDEAQELAKSRDLHLPTEGEWEKMIGAGSTWDDDRKGIWIGKNHFKKKETKYSTFLPAAGLRNRNNGALNSVGTNGYYWSSTVSGTVARYLSFNSGLVSVYVNSRAWGFSVRCVAE